MRAIDFVDKESVLSSPANCTPFRFFYVFLNDSAVDYDGHVGDIASTATSPDNTTYIMGTSSYRTALLSPSQLRPPLRLNTSSMVRFKQKPL
eukprot:IDg14892t1